jgi:hypothetical protein
LKPPGSKRLKLRCDEPPSNFDFDINLRRYDQPSPVVPVITRNTSHVSDYSISTSASGGSGGYGTPVRGTAAAAAADKKKRTGDFSR